MNFSSYHDKFLKSILQQPARARDYFRLQLPPALTERLDWESLTLVPESFVDEHLQTSFSDLIYSVRMNGEEHHLYLSLLLEHKSQPDPYVTIQIGHYIFSALHRQVRDGKKPTPVIPVLFYHGEQSMPYRRHRELYSAWGEAVQRFVPDFDYVYHDLQQCSAEDLEQVNIHYLRTMFLLMKWSRNQPQLLKQTNRIFGMILDEDRNFLQPVIVYFYSLVKDKLQLMDAIKQMPEPLQQEAQNAYEALILEGLEQGLRKGMEKGMEKGLEKGMEEGLEKGARNTLLKSIKGLFINGVSIELIATGLEVSEEEVDRILQQEGLK